MRARFHGPPANSTLGEDCLRVDILGDAIETCSVYLFPFIIE